MNMGGPNNLDEVEVFLTNMFNDKRIIAYSLHDCKAHHLQTQG